MFKKILIYITDLSLSVKFLISFFLIFLLNLIVALIFLNTASKLKLSVDNVYDKIFMANTFALTAKYRLAEIDKLISSFNYSDKKTISKKIIIDSIQEEIEILKEDLDVVLERSHYPNDKNLTVKSQVLLNEYRQNLDINLDLILKSQVINEVVSNSLKLSKQLQASLNTLTDSLAANGYDYRQLSEIQHKSVLRFFYISCALLFFVTLILAFYLVQTIVRPLKSYASFCNDLDLNKSLNRFPTYGKNSEIAILGKSINSMLQKINEKTNDLNTLFSSVNQAIFSFNKDGLIGSEKSQFSYKLFPHFKFVSIHDFWDKYSNINLNQSQKICDTLWDKNLEIDFDSLVLGILPEKISFNTPENVDKQKIHIALRYQKHLDTLNNLEKIIVLIEDITFRVESEQEMSAQAERVQRITKASASLESYKQLVFTAKELFRKSHDLFSEGSLKDKNALKHCLHTLKGTLSFIDHKTSALQIHEVETYVNHSMENPFQVKDKIEKIETVFNNETQDILQLLNVNINENFISVNIKKINLLKKYCLDAIMDISTLNELVQSLERKSPKEILLKYEDYLNNIATKQDKKIKLSFSPNTDELSPSEFNKIEDALAHLFRNCLDHGIETSEVRSQLNKTEAGQIFVSFKRSPQSLFFEISDDGQGIDLEKIKIKALEKGLLKSSELDLLSREKIINLIFEPDFSTKDTISETSGRGVGMNIVKEIILSLNGTILVETSIGKGTTFKIMIPL